MSDADRPDNPEDRPERGSRFRRLGRRILGENEDGRTILGDAKEVFGAVLEGGDKAKTEVVRAVAREVRTYLDELGLKDDVRHLLTNYSVEVKASFNLRRLVDDDKVPARRSEGSQGAAPPGAAPRKDEARGESGKSGPEAE